MSNRSKRRSSAARLATSVCAIAATVFAGATPAHSWGLKTHIWIAQQVLTDAADGSVTIAGGEYPLSMAVRNSLRNYPERFRAGALGPDVYPDPLVGQTTTHPGVENGWQADDWLEWLGSKARTAEEISFFYGYTSHFAGDIFAHTYVNAYAGDVFDLTDKESDVERRHVALEKYIDAHLPPAMDPAGQVIGPEPHLKTARQFLRDHLVLRHAPAKEYRVPTALHLAAMNEVYRALDRVETDAADLEKRLLGSLEALQIEKTAADVAFVGAKGELAIAKEKLRAIELKLEASRVVQGTHQEALGKAQEIVEKYPALISADYELIDRQWVARTAAHRAADDLVNKAQRLHESLEGKFQNIVRDLAHWDCKFLNLPHCGPLRKALDEINDLIRAANAEAEAAKEAYAAASAATSETHARIIRLQTEKNAAESQLYKGTLAAQLEASRLDVKGHEADLQIQRTLLAKAEDGVALAEKTAAAAAEKLNAAAGGVAGFGLVQDYLRGWVKAMNIAGEEYIKASETAGYQMLSMQGKPLDTYAKWVKCYGSAFMGVPRQIGDVSCFVTRGLYDLQESIDKFVEGLPEPLQWAVTPGEKLWETAVRELGPRIGSADTRLSAFVALDGASADLLLLLSEPTFSTRDKLNGIFAADMSGKRLLKFGAVADLIDKDIGMQNGRLDPASFAALTHSVTLAKLSLLSGKVLDQLIFDLGPYGEPREIYGFDEASRKTILHRSVKSLDGNHQWQAYGLPHPRRSGKLASPKHLPFGRDGYRNPADGFKLWTDPILRQTLFSYLFPKQIIGELGKRPELSSPAYPFPSCDKHLFPRTQTPDGKIQAKDSSCLERAR